MMESEKYNSEINELWQSALEQDLFPGNLVVEIGKFFLGAPYQAGTLETEGREKLEINLAAFDCTTFVETVLALAQCATAGNLSPLQFRKELKFIRYRQGKINGYASRLHYFTDWLRDNEQKKVVKNVSRLLGGKPVRKKINFMTTHRELYTALNNKAAFEEMQKVEQALSRRTLYLMAKNRVMRPKSMIQQGDIIAFATDQEGLDVAHAGFAVWQGKNLHLLHASNKKGAVVISPETLPAYLKANKKCTGIFVARFASAGNLRRP
jgi:hypothetical protein